MDNITIPFPSISVDASGISIELPGGEVEHIGHGRRDWGEFKRFLSRKIGRMEREDLIRLVLSAIAQRCETPQDFRRIVNRLRGENIVLTISVAGKSTEEVARG